MEKSESIGQLATALAIAQGALKPAAFNRVNPHFKSRYADLTSVIDASRKALAENGLSIAQFPSADGSKVSVRTVLAHKSGEWISDVLTLTASKPDPQGVGSAITYAKRYAWAAILGISADEDDDANEASAPNKSQRPVPEQNGKAESPKTKFANIIGEWAKVAPEDRKAVALQVAKAVGFDLGKATDDDFNKAAAYVQSNMSKPFTEWAKENA